MIPKNLTPNWFTKEESESNIILWKLTTLLISYDLNRLRFKVKRDMLTQKHAAGEQHGINWVVLCQHLEIFVHFVKFTYHVYPGSRGVNKRRWLTGSWYWQLDNQSTCRPLNMNIVVEPDTMSDDLVTAVLVWLPDWGSDEVVTGLLL